jgi:uncharacterized protein YbjQ (UPF0145 family)
MTGSSLAAAASRILALPRSGSAGGPFSSNLSVDEVLAVKEAGYEPVGLVQGAAVYHVGYAFTPMMATAEITVLSRAMTDARERALGRLADSAARLSAAGVIGVEVDLDHLGHHLRVQVTGTAVASHSGHRAMGRPFTSDLSGQEFYLLHRAGYRPLKLVMGVCVYHIARRGMSQAVGGMRVNAELEQYTNALYSAREDAMERLQTEATQAGASGVVGVKVVEKSHIWGHQTIEFLCMGTAITSDGQTFDPEPVMAVTLDD